MDTPLDLARMTSRDGRGTKAVLAEGMIDDLPANREPVGRR